MIMQVLLITLLSFVANAIGTISGFGVGTIMTPVLLLFMPFTETILLVCIIHWFHDIFKMGFFHKGIDWKLLLYFGLPTVIATFIGALLVTKEQSALLSSLLGLFLIGSVVLMYTIDWFRIPNNWLSGMVGGLLSGFFAGIFGIRGAVRAVFLSAFDLHKATFVGTTGAISLMLDSVRLVTYWARGLTIPMVLLWSMLLFIPVSFLGTYVGQHVVRKIPQQYFHAVVSFFLVLVGIKLLITPWL